MRAYEVKPVNLSHRCISLDLDQSSSKVKKENNLFHFKCEQRILIDHLIEEPRSGVLQQKVTLEVKKQREKLLKMAI